jgi:hypothetical protein
MSDTELLAVGVVAIITAISSLALVVLKLIKKSTCCGIAFETRESSENTTNPTIIISSQPPSPVTTHRASPIITHKEYNV